jgi:hypothetical protein
MKNIFYILNIAAAVASNATSIEHNIADHFATTAKMTREKIFEAYKEQSGEHPLAKILSQEKLPRKLAKIKKILDERSNLNITALALMDLLRVSINPKSETPNPPMEADILHHATSYSADLLRFILTLGFMPADTTTEQAEEMAEKIFARMWLFYRINSNSNTSSKTLAQVKLEIREMHTLLKDNIFTYFSDASLDKYMNFMRAIPTLSETNLHSLAVIQLYRQAFRSTALEEILNDDPFFWGVDDQDLILFQLAAILSDYNSVFQAICRLEPASRVEEIKTIQSKVPPNTSVENFFSMLERSCDFRRSLDMGSVKSFNFYDSLIKASVFLSKDSRLILMSLKTICELYKNKKLSKYDYSRHYSFPEKLFTLDAQQLEKLASSIADLPFNEEELEANVLQTVSHINQYLDSM